jgi:pimeloyl-ACP methyl ester carboxylesterase
LLTRRVVQQVTRSRWWGFAGAVLLVSRSRWWGVAGAVLLVSRLAAVAVAAEADLPTQVAPGQAAVDPETLKVGTMVLHRCETGAPWCGALVRPLDPAGVVPGAISIYFEFYPHTDEGKSAETLVATEGGPGFAATDSRDEYLELFRPLRGGRDVVLMDNRGTGRSGAIDCHPLQTEPTLTYPWGEGGVIQCHPRGR